MIIWISLTNPLHVSTTNNTQNFNQILQSRTVSWILKLVKVKCFGFSVSRTQKIWDKIPVNFSKELKRRNEVFFLIFCLFSVFTVQSQAFIYSILHSVP